MKHTTWIVVLLSFVMACGDDSDSGGSGNAQNTNNTNSGTTQGTNNTGGGTGGNNQGLDCMQVCKDKVTSCGAPAQFAAQCPMVCSMISGSQVACLRDGMCETLQRLDNIGEICQQSTSPTTGGGTTGGGGTTSTPTSPKAKSLRISGSNKGSAPRTSFDSDTGTLSTFLTLSVMPVSHSPSYVKLAFNKAKTTTITSPKPNSCAYKMSILNSEDALTVNLEGSDTGTAKDCSDFITAAYEKGFKVDADGVRAAIAGGTYDVSINVRP